MPQTTQPQPSSAPSAIILAAGMGKRMQSDLPKVLHPVGQPPRPMVCAVIDACKEAGCKRIVLVIGHKADLVRQAMAAAYGLEHDIEFAIQAEQLGTGHAVMAAKDLFTSEASAPGREVFVLAGDGPLIRPMTLRQMLDTHRKARAGATIATSVIPDPTGYGRIYRGPDNRFRAIVEHKNCTPEQLAIREVYPSYAVFDAQKLFATLPDVPKNPVGGEYYLTDAYELMLARSIGVEVVQAVPPEDVLSINTPEQLAEVDAIYRARATAQSQAPARSGARA
ncbi:MAG: NTP transferase domain-containing protein [Phycisphaerales bacterium]|nr:NTP transferase domain-containing protein [Phycisphaerales bacterium]